MEAVVTVDAVETGEEIEEDVVIEGPVVVVEEEAEEEEGVVARELIQTMLMHFHHYDREKSRGASLRRHQFVVSICHVEYISRRANQH